MKSAEERLSRKRTLARQRKARFLAGKKMKGWYQLRIWVPEIKLAEIKTMIKNFLEKK